MVTVRHPPSSATDTELKKTETFLSSQERIAQLAESVFLSDGGLSLDDSVILLLQLVQWKTPYGQGLVDAVTQYIRKGLSKPTSSKQLTTYTVLASALPELHHSQVLEEVIQRIAQQADSLDTSAVGLISYRLSRMPFQRQDALTQALGRCAVRVGESNDVFSMVQLFCFLCPQPALSAPQLSSLCEGIMTATLDRDTIASLCEALACLTPAQQDLIPSEWSAMVAAVASQAKEIIELPAEDGGLVGEKPEKDVHKFLTAFLKLQNNCAGASQGVFRDVLPSLTAYLTPLKEGIASADPPPYRLVMRLLQTNDTHCVECGLELLEELALQQHSLSSVQSFRFLLLLGDHRLTQRERVVDYVMDQFLKTATGIPPVQFCAALRSVRRVSPLTDRRPPLWLDKLFTFSKDLLLHWYRHPTPTECVMEAVVHLHALGVKEKEELWSAAAAFLAKKIDVVDASGISRQTAAELDTVLGDAVLSAHPSVAEFLKKVQSCGTEESDVTPTEWLAKRDLASRALPLTKEQQACVDIVDAMFDTRADERERLVSFAQSYVSSVHLARPDDHKFFFAACEEKVLKEDKLLQECLKTMVTQSIVPRLSPPTIAGVLESLSSLRFIYTRTIRQFVEAMSEEQWMDMAAAPLVQLLTALSRWPVRSPSVNAAAVKRLSELHSELTGRQVAEAIRALLTLSVSPRSDVFPLLMARASRLASTLDESCLQILFSAPNAYRLLTDESVSMPLLLAASQKVKSPTQRERIAKKVALSDLPRESLGPQLQRLQSAAGSSSKPLQLSN